MNIIIDTQNGQDALEFADDGLSPAIASRATDPDFSATTAYLPNPDIVLDKMSEKISIYDSLMADDEVWTSFEKLTGGAKRHRYELIQGKLDKKVYQMLKGYFDEFKWTTFIESVLRARLYGFQPMEILWHEKDGALLPRSIEARPQSRFLFSVADNSPLLVTKDEKEGIWKEEWNNSFIFPTYHRGRSPYGEAVLGKCFWNVMAKRGGLKWWMAFLEKYGTPWLVMYAAKGADKKALFEAGKKAIRDAVLLIPEGTRAEIVESTQKGQSTSAHEQFLAYHDKKISKVITTEALTGDNNGVGSYAASNTAESILDTAISSCVELITETVEDLGRKIAMVNAGVDSGITFEGYDPMYTNLGRAKLDEILFKIGVKPTDPYIIKWYRRQPEEFILDSTAGASQPTTFAGEDIPSDQLAIDTLAEKLFNNTKDNQAAIRKLTDPVMKFIEGAISFEGVQENLAAQFPKMDSTELQRMIYKLIASAKLWGEMHAGSDE